MVGCAGNRAGPGWPGQAVPLQPRWYSEPATRGTPLWPCTDPAWPDNTIHDHAVVDAELAATSHLQHQIHGRLAKVALSARFGGAMEANIVQGWRDPTLSL